MDPLFLTVLSFGILAVTSVFICLFVFEPWWRSAFGQSVMALALAVWIFSLLAVLRQVLGDDYAARVWLLGAGRTLALLAISQRTYVLVTARRRQRA